MATSVAFSKRELLKAIKEVEKPEIRDYLGEAARCLCADANRAAVILGWSALVSLLRQTIKEVGFAYFRDTAEKLAAAHRIGLKPDRLSLDNWDQGFVKDQHLLEICQHMNLISEADKKELVQFAELRNDCAHPSAVEVKSSRVITLLEIILGRASSTDGDGWSLTATYFERFLTIPADRLDKTWLKSLMTLLRKADYLRLVDRLLTVYNDPGGLFGRKDEVEINTSSSVAIQDTVSVMWAALAGYLDPRAKANANRKLAELFKKGASRDLWWRNFVFWDQLNMINARPRRLITAWLVYEFRTLVEAAERCADLHPVKPADVDRLDTMTRYADLDIHAECTDLLARARKVPHQLGT